MSEYLPDVIVEDILRRLPLRSIGKCMLVCKAWNIIIKSHTFTFSHLQHSLSNPSSPMVIMGTRSRSYKKQDEFSLCSSFSSFPRIENIKHSLPNPNYAASLLQSVGAINGVVCLYNLDLEYIYITDNIILWNPLIDRHLKLPTPLFTFKNLYKAGLGFGFDSKKNDFKLLRIVYPIPPTGWDDTPQKEKKGDEFFSWIPKVELYSLNEGAWRVIDDDDDDDSSSHGLLRRKISEKTPCFFNGNVHWIAYDKYGISDFILIFNMVEEKFNRMELPEEVKIFRSWESLDVSVIEDCLSLIEYIGGSDWAVQRCNIWMKRESWNKVYSVYLEDGIIKVLGLNRSSEVLVVTMQQRKSFHFVDLKKSMGVKDIRIKTSTHAWAYDYTESLLFLDKENN
ncbi:F-box/kelch-repeat protein At3g23880-like [Gastrolobium bilobum]|uniref:F-box/kelch-repeat protein At3g23880-like n=1 Tax=Gastrolobium bilobum TaxID=150636 RepID=UPI002AAF9363|nr:F-box/kelch-repeat protein At3g23880-like [Gastrolobium bilobum]